MIHFGSYISVTWVSFCGLDKARFLGINNLSKLKSNFVVMGFKKSRMTFPKVELVGSPLKYSHRRSSKTQNLTLPQNLVLTLKSCHQVQWLEAAWQADTGGWCDTCSLTNRKPRSSRMHSYVSPGKSEVYVINNNELPLSITVTLQNQDYRKLGWIIQYQRYEWKSLPFRFSRYKYFLIL